MKKSIFFENLKTSIISMDIFSVVKMVSRVPIQQLSEFQFPICFITDNGTQNNREHPGLLEQSFSLVCFSENISDYASEQQIIDMHKLQEDVLEKLLAITYLGSGASEEFILLWKNGIPSPQEMTGNYPIHQFVISGKTLLSIY